MEIRRRKEREEENLGEKEKAKVLEGKRKKS